MVSRFLIKVILIIVVVGGAIVEFGSPLVVRAQLDGVANDAASDAAFTMFQTRDANQARATAEQVVSTRDATFKNLQVDPSGAVTVTVGREAPSLIAKRWLASWYDVEVSSSAVRKAG